LASQSFPPPPSSTLFPYTTLFRSDHRDSAEAREDRSHGQHAHPPPFVDVGELPVIAQEHHEDRDDVRDADGNQVLDPLRHRRRRDRKSTRLNSSHVSISYAVFCLK